MVMSAAQTGLKPTTVTCEMRICGDWTGLNASVKHLSRAYLQRMWEAWHCWGGRTKPACMYVHCSLRARQLHNHQASSAYISKELVSVTPAAAKHYCIYISVCISKQRQRKHLDLKGFTIMNTGLTKCPFYVLYHWSFNGNIFAIKYWKWMSGQTNYLKKQNRQETVEVNIFFYNQCIAVWTLWRWHLFGVWT